MNSPIPKTTLTQWPLFAYCGPKKDGHGRISEGHIARPTQPVSTPLDGEQKRKKHRSSVKPSEKGALDDPLSSPHQPFPYGLRDQLCHRCSAIDFRRLFSKGSHVDVTKDSVVGMCLNGFDMPDFGSRDGLTRSRRCPFCRLVLDLVRRRSIIQPPWSQEEHWSIEAVATDDGVFLDARKQIRIYSRGFEHQPDFCILFLPSDQARFGRATSWEISPQGDSQDDIQVWSVFFAMAISGVRIPGLWGLSTAKVFGLLNLQHISAAKRFRFTMARILCV